VHYLRSRWLGVQVHRRVGSEVRMCVLLRVKGVHFDVSQYDRTSLCTRSGDITQSLSRAQYDHLMNEAAWLELLPLHQSLKGYDTRLTAADVLQLKSAMRCGEDQFVALMSADLHGIDLHGLELNNWIFNGCNLKHVLLRKARLKTANFDDSILTNASLIGADLTGAKFRNADLRCADLSLADFTGADLSGANLSGANLTGTNFTNAILAGCEMRDCTCVSTNFTSANLTNALFTGRCSDCTFIKTKMLGIDLSMIDLKTCTLTGIDLTGADLTVAQLGDAPDLTDAVLADAKVANMDLRHFKLDGADLSRCDLRLVRLPFSLQRVTLADVQLRPGTDFMEFDLSGADLSGMDVRGKHIKLAGCKLSRCVLPADALAGRDISCADLRGADIAGFSLEGTDVHEAKFDASHYDHLNFKPALNFIGHILTLSQAQLVLSWIGAGRTLQPLYSSDLHGDEAKVFHERCDHKGATLTVIRVGNCVFGGYASSAFNSSGSYIGDSRAFLFSLTNPAGVGPQRLNVSSSTSALLGDSGSGPRFGRSSLCKRSILFV